MSSPSAAGSMPTSSEVIRNAAAGRRRERDRRQHLRGDGGSRAAGAPVASAGSRASAPDAKIVVTGCAAQTEPQTFADMPEVAIVARQRGEDQREFWAEQRDVLSPSIVRARKRRKSPRQRHHGGARDRAAPGRRHRRATRARSCRCRTAATTAAPSASSRSGAGIRARCRWARSSRRCAGSPNTAIARWC